MSMVMKMEEQAALSLKRLYHSYGYAPYKMSKFEEYELYVKNKNFLVSGEILSFTDLSGKLLAMKPDVTLSIVKNFSGEQKSLSKVYYNENVYRCAPGTHEFREIMQTGLECMGNLDMYSQCEVVMLAAKSLEEISGDYIMDISSVGIISGLLNEMGVDEKTKREISGYIVQKNIHNMASLCEEKEIDNSAVETLKKIALMYGPLGEKLPELKNLCINAEMKGAYLDLETVYLAMKSTGEADKINLDFSIITDMKYYNGIVFKGYINGLPDSVLSGGRYDNLMAGMGKKAGAIGFAVYLDKLERLDKKTTEYDVDVLLTYGESVQPQAVLKKAEKLIVSGKTVRVQAADDGSVRFRETVEVTGVEEND